MENLWKSTETLWKSIGKPLENHRKTLEIHERKSINTLEINRNTLEKTKGKPRGKGKGRPIHQDYHSVAIKLRERGISNVEHDDVYVMWVNADFIYEVLKETYQDKRHMKLVDIEKKLIKKIRPIGNCNV